MTERWRNALWGVLWLVLSGVLMLVAGHEADRQEDVRMRSFRGSVTALADISEAIVASRIDQYDDSLLFLREAFVADPARFPHNLELLRSGALADREVLVVLVGREGRLIFTDAPNVEPGLSVADRAYFRFFSEGGKDRLYIDEPVFGRVTRRYALPLARPIYDKQGTFRGVLAISVIQDSLVRFGSQPRPSSDTTVTLVAQSGAVIARSRDADKVRGSTLPAERMALLRAGGSGSFAAQSPVDGDARFIAFRHVEGTPVIVVVEASLADVAREIAAQHRALFASAGVACFLSLLLLLAYLRGRRITARYIDTQQAHLKEAQRIAGMGSWEFDPDRARFRLSDEACRLIGIARESSAEALDAFLARVVESDRATVRDFIAAAATEASGSFEFCVQGAAGEPRHLIWRSETLRSKAGKLESLIGTFTDVTARKRAERELTRQKDLYEMLSRTNETIVRGGNREELFREVCRIAVEKGHFLFAWMGLLDKDKQRLEPVALHGEDKGYVRARPFSMDESKAEGRGMVAQVLRTGRHAYTNDLFTDPRVAPWHELALRAGVRALASCPIRQGGAVIGVMNFYAGERDYFTENLLATLDEMAADVSFALDNFERETERRRAERKLAEAEAQFRGLVEQSIAGIYIIQDGKFAYVNPCYAEIFGYASAGEMIGLDALSLVAEKDRGAAAENIRRWIEGGAQSLSYGFTGRRKDGASVEVGLHSTRASYRGRPAIIGLLQDISEKKRAEEKAEGYLEQLQRAFMDTVQMAMTLGEMRDPYTAGHERRVAEIAVAIGAELGFDARRQEGLRVAGYLHDIGKITIPAEILAKPGKLSAIEFALVKTHAQAGCDILKGVEFPWPVAEVALQHHERLDGSGYPQGLKGEAILLEARILAVADVIEAMSSYRPYRPGLGIDKALAEIERGRGTAYDAVVADACLTLFREKGYALPD